MQEGNADCERFPPLPELKYKSTMQKNFSVNLLDSGKLQVLLTTDTEEYCVQGKTDYQ